MALFVLMARQMCLIISSYIARELRLRNQARRDILLADAVAIHESAHP
ncbi:MAG: hypothetical protein ACYSTS_19390 [Planctomycetota bacterium]